MASMAIGLNKCLGSITNFSVAPLKKLYILAVITNPMPLDYGTGEDLVHFF